MTGLHVRGLQSANLAGLALLAAVLCPSLLHGADAEGRWTTGRKNVFVLHQQGEKLTEFHTVFSI